MEYHILNLGAGVQSTALYLLDLDGELLEETGIKFTHAIFADTQEEPDSVYEHLTWLEKQGGIPILKATRGKLGDDLLSSDQKWPIGIPAFVVQDGKKGMIQRQCTSKYKVDVVNKVLRQQILGRKPRQRIPKELPFTQYMGFSFDEAGRAARAKGRFQQRGWNVEFPLFDMQWKRSDCIAYLEDRVPHRVPRSACSFCPFRSDRSWLALKNNDPDGWERSIEIDEGLRVGQSAFASKFDGQLFLHRSCKPLAEADLGQDQGKFDFMAECEGGCGL